MAEGTYYAYSTFNTEVDEWGRVQKSIKPGEEVSQSDLGVDDETWAEYVKSGVVSTVPHPEDMMDGESPNEAFAREDAALAAGELDDEQAAKVEERQEAQKAASSNVHDEAAKLASAGDDAGAESLIEESAEAESENPNEPTGDSEPPQPTQLPAEPASASRDYASMTVEQLKTLAGKREIEGRGTMNKDALVAALQESDKA
jgi:hypothetical protein